MPMAYSLATGFTLEQQMEEAVRPNELVKVLLGEFIYVAGFAATLVFFESMRSSETTAAEITITPHTKRLLIVLGCLGAAIAVSILLSPVQTLAEGSEHMAVKTYSGPVDLIETWLSAGFWCSGLYAGGVLFVAPFVSRAGRLIGLSAVLPLAVFGMLSGIRGRVIWAVMSVLIAGVIFGARRKVGIALCGLVVSLPFFAVMGNLNFRYAMAAELGGKSIFEVLPLLGAAQSQVASGGVKDMSDSLVARAMAARNSVILYRLYDRGEGCGLAALSSSIYLPIPRFLWPSKRPAGSCDSTEYGGAMYQVMSRGYASPYWVMGPYLASAHAYFDGGWIAVILFGPILGAAWSLICWFAEKRPMATALVYVMVFLSAFTLDGLFTGVAPIHELVRAFWLSFVPLYSLDKTVGLLSRLRVLPSRRLLLRSGEIE